MDKPSIAIWIDPQTQNVKIDFTPQLLQPGQYGVVLASVMVHIARLFCDSNKGVTEDAMLDAIAVGINAALEQRTDMTAPTHLH